MSSIDSFTISQQSELNFANNNKLCQLPWVTVQYSIIAIIWCTGKHELFLLDQTKQSTRDTKRLLENRKLLFLVSCDVTYNRFEIPLFNTPFVSLNNYSSYMFKLYAHSCIYKYWYINIVKWSTDYWEYLQIKKM